jgi:cytochrome c oxidase subunit 3
MLALPPAPSPAPRRQVLVGAAVGSAAAAMLIGGMLSLFLRFRHEAQQAGDLWIPKGVAFPEVACNVMLLGFVPICVFAAWAIYAARNDDKQHAALALGLVGVVGIAVVNAQANIYAQMKVAATDGPYGPMFYAVTGTFVVLVVIGIAFSAVTAFRFLGGRSTEREIVTAHGVYWFALSAIFFVLWFVVYVKK